MNGIRWLLMFAFLLTGCAPGAAAQPQSATPVQESKPAMNTSPTSQPGRLSSLPDLGPAPELTNTIWLNTDHPLRLADLRGKVTALEMWTFDCINCRHVIPSLRGWDQQYRDQGLVIIGNHYPEFDHERSLENLKLAIANEQIRYPVAQDNDGATWDAYHNRYWPALYLIDKRGHIRYRQIGEGGYDQTEAAIRALLAESDS
jgi:thiol-disulfide isomerase/thioredoxin